MTSESGELQEGGTMPDGAADETSRRAQIEQRLQHIFRLAGDSDAARQLMQMVIEYRWRQGQ